MVIAQLEKQDVENICDLLYDAPSDAQYTAIKERLISVYEESDSRQLHKLLSEMDLGDQKPSQLLRRMRTLARNKVPDDTLRLMWTNLLPPHVRSVLAVSDTIGKQAALDELAKLADKMIEVQQIEAVSSTHPSTHSSTSTAQIDVQFLVEEIRKLHTEIAELKQSRHYTHFSRNHYAHRSRNRRPALSPSRSHLRHRSLSRSSPQDSTTISPYCYYHRRFGAEARRCTTPCTFNKQQEN
jgi:hypothetical protein